MTFGTRRFWTRATGLVPWYRPIRRAELKARLRNARRWLMVCGDSSSWDFRCSNASIRSEETATKGSGASSVVSRCFLMVRSAHSCEGLPAETVTSHQLSSSANEPPPSEGVRGSSPSRSRSLRRSNSDARCRASVLVRAAVGIFVHRPAESFTRRYHRPPR